MTELDLLVENYFTGSFKTSDLLRLVEELTNAPDQGRKRNIDLAIGAVEGEGLEYDVSKNIIRVKDDDRLEVMNKLASVLEPMGFVYNPEGGSSSIGRIQIIDREFGNAYIIVKTKSRKGAATKGYDYENKLRDNINQRYGDMGISAESAGPGHGSDLTIYAPELPKPLKIEVKTSLGADFGQFRVQYNTQTDSWEPRRTEGYKKSEKIFQPLFDKYLKDHMNQNYRFLDLKDPRLRKDKNGKIAGLAKSPTTGEFKRQIESSWFNGKTDYKVAFPFEEISSYYVDKGDKYIQLGTKGLFALSDEAAKLLGIPKFSDSGIVSFLRLRFKPSYGANSPTSFTVAVKLQGAIEKSNINLQNDEDLDKLIQTIKR